MARRIGARVVEVAGLRGALIAHLDGLPDRLFDAGTEVYDFRLECDALAGLVEDLRAGRDVYIPSWRIPREHRPASGRVFWLRGDQLVPADDTIMSTLDGATL